EPGHFDRNRVIARLQQARFEIALAVGDETLRNVRLRIGDLDVGAGNGARGVLDGSRDRSPRFLRKRRQRSEQTYEHSSVKTSHDTLLLRSKDLDDHGGRLPPPEQVTPVRTL